VNGIELKNHFRLNDFPKVYIQKVFNSTIPIYIITFNSKYSSQHIPRKMLYFNNSSMYYRFKGPQAKFIRLSPPMLIEEFNYNLSSNAFIFVRDLGGERYLTKRNVYPDNLSNTGLNLNKEY